MSTGKLYPGEPKEPAALVTQVQGGRSVEVDSPFSRAKVGRRPLVGVEVVIRDASVRYMVCPVRA